MNVRRNSSHNRRSLFESFSQRLLTICSIFSVCGYGNKVRPSVEMNIENVIQNCTYDTGASISCTSTRLWRKLPPDKRPQKLDMHVTATSASGEKLDIQGCYLMKCTVFGRTIEHPFFVCRNLKSDTLLGIDFIKAAGLNFDAYSGEVYLREPSGKSKDVKLMTRQETYIAPRSTAVVSASLQDNRSKVRPILSTCVIDIGLNGCPQLANDNVLLQSDKNGLCKMLLTNSGVTPLRLPRLTNIGNGYLIDDKQAVKVEEITEILAEMNPKSDKKLPTLKDIEWVRENADLSHLPNEFKKKYENLLIKYHHIFSKHKNDLGRCTMGKHTIPLKNDSPVYQKQFPIPYSHQDEILKAVQEWLQLDIIEKADSPYNSSLFCVPKKMDLAHADGTQKMSYRIVADFRGLNNVTNVTKYRLPLIHECIDEIGKNGSKLFSCLDLRQAFLQVLLDKRDRPKTAFTVPNLGQFQFKRAIYGLAGIPMNFQRIMNRIFSGLSPKIITIYLDDGLVKSKTHEDMLENLELCFERLDKANLKLGLNKCRFGVKQCTYLGYTLTEEGYKPNKSKLKAIDGCSPPASAKQIRSFLGMCGYFRSSIFGYAQLAKHLSKLTCKTSDWKGGPLPQKSLWAFNELKRLLCSEPVLAYPTKDGEYHLYVDASLGDAYDKDDGGLSALLVQMQDGVPKAIGYASRSLTSFEKNYSSYLLEMAACCYGLEQYHLQLFGTCFVLHSDSKPISQVSKKHTRTLNRLQYLMTQYNFRHEWIPGDLNISDYCSRNVASIMIDDAMKSSKLPHLPDEEYKKLQSFDPFCSALKTFIQTGKLPSISPLRNVIKKYGPKCAIKNGFLSILLERMGHMPKWLKVAPASLHADILVSAHASQFAGHGKEFKTTERILQSQWWPTLSSDARSFISTCVTCQQAAKPSAKPNTKLQPLPLPEAPFSRVHVDLYGPLVTGNSGKKFILVIVDHFTKVTEFVAIVSKEAEVVAKAIFDSWITRYGTMDYLISDLGKEFESQVSNELYKMLGVDKRHTTARHPQSNSSSEIKMKFISSYLKSMLEKNVLDWESMLPYLRFTYNTGVSAATKQSPYFLLYGLHPKSPHFDPEFSNRVTYGANYAHTIMNRLKIARKLAYDNNISYQDAYKNQYDKNVKEMEFQEGQLVWLHRPELAKVNKKIAREFDGPYVIISLPNSTNAVIQCLKSHKTRVVHRLRLKHFKGQLPSKVMNKDDAAVAAAAGNADSDTPELQNARVAKNAEFTKNADSRPGCIRIEEEDVVILNANDPPPIPIPVKVETPEKEVIVKKEIVSDSESPGAASILKEVFTTPISPTEIARQTLPTRLTRQAAAKSNIEVHDESLPDKPIEYKGRKTNK